MNERGNTTLFGLMLVMVISMIGLHLIKLRVDYTKSNEQFQKLLLCSKETNGETKQFYDRISKSNAFIKALTITEYTSTVIPIYGVVASNSAAQAVEAIKLIQVGYLLSYLNKLRELTQKNCFLSPNIYKTPYELSITSGLERNQFEEAKLRGDNWKYANMNAKSMIVTKLQFKPNWEIKSSLMSLGMPF